MKMGNRFGGEIFGIMNKEHRFLIFEVIHPLIFYLLRFDVPFESIKFSC